MRREHFASHDWWLTHDEIQPALEPLRDGLGEAFGWPESTWYAMSSRLEEVFDFIQSNQSALLTELDDCNSDEQRSEWIRTATRLRRPDMDDDDSTESLEDEAEESDDSIESSLTDVEELERKEPQPDPTPQRSSIFEAKKEPALAGLPSLANLSAMEQTLMAGALEKNSVDDAVRQIYDNMHQRTGWKYNASIRTVNGADYIKGANTVGMCESYRNAFAAAVLLYDRLRETHPVEAVRTADLVVDKDDTLAAQKFCTREGLTLMGGGLKGNVSMQVDGTGALIARGVESINRFVFSGHWTSRINGVVYDPIFHSINEDNIEIRLEGATYTSGDGARFVPNTKEPVPTGEFGATYIWITEWDDFRQTVDDMKELYAKHQSAIDKIIDDGASIKEGFPNKKDKPCYAEARALVDERVGNISIFQKIVKEGSVFKREDTKAVDKILEVAAKR